MDEGTCLAKQNIFSTFMYQGKHANYMQINFLLLVKEKKTELSKKRKETSILPSFTLVFFKEQTLCSVEFWMAPILIDINIYTKQTEISSVLSNMIIVILLLNLKSKKRLKTLLWVVWTKQWDNQSVTNYFYLSIDQLIHQLLFNPPITTHLIDQSVVCH